MVNHFHTLGALDVKTLSQSKTVKDIFDVFIKYNFQPLTYKDIAGELKRKVNTIIQRIQRYKDKYFNISEKRPYKITLKEGIEDIIFHRDKNQCHICRRTYNPKLLTLRLKDPNLQKKYVWDNVITCCQNCKNKEIVKKLSKQAKKSKKAEGSGRIPWEYLEIRVRKVVKTMWDIMINTPPQPTRIVGYEEYELPLVRHDMMLEQGPDIYYEFDEMNGRGWYHLTGDEGQTASKTLRSILDYFGSQGWELVSIIKTNEWQKFGFQYPAPNAPEEYHCVFKREKREEDSDDE